VYIPRRDTSSRLAALAGGRVFPGYLHLARFRAHEDDEEYRIQVASRDAGHRRCGHAGHDMNMPPPLSGVNDLG
jgi:hypothetical protein